MTRRAFLGFFLFTLVVSGLCIALGAWQLQRHYWKADLLTDAADMALSPAVPMPAIPEGLDAYQPLKLSGQFIAGQDIPIYGFAVSGVSGSRLYAPFALADGRILIVQRGWAPRGTEADKGVADTDLKQIEVVWRPVKKRPAGSGLFSLANAPDQGVWTYIDPAALAEYWQQPNLIQAGYGELRAPIAAADGLLVEAFRSDLFNRHLEYVATWWCLAAGLLGIFALIWWDQRRRAP